jgi:hypothetical protein
MAYPRIASGTDTGGGRAGDFDPEPVARDRERFIDAVIAHRVVRTSGGLGPAFRVYGRQRPRPGFTGLPQLLVPGRSWQTASPKRLQHRISPRRSACLALGSSTMASPAVGDLARPVVLDQSMLPAADRLTSVGHNAAAQIGPQDRCSNPQHHAPDKQISPSNGDVLPGALRTVFVTAGDAVNRFRCCISLKRRPKCCRGMAGARALD